MVDEWSGWVEPYFVRYGYWFVFIALFLENVLFLGVLIPGAVVLVLCGWLTQKAGALPNTLILVGFLGTLMGDTTSYAIGKKMGSRLLSSPKWGKGTTALSARVRHEPVLLMFCHFVSYLRMFVPLSAGISEVPLRRWLALDATGAALWVSSHVLLGYFLSTETASLHMKQIGALTLVALVVYLGVRQLLQRRAR